jgi:hypothetical protein
MISFDVDNIALLLGWQQYFAKVASTFMLQISDFWT